LPDGGAERPEELSQARAGDLEAERAFVARLYARLAEIRSKLEGELGRVRGSPGGTAQWKTERDALAANLEDRLAALAMGDLALCFGRLDMLDRARYHIGRLGVADQDYEPLLIDWRAPAAQPFYRATAADPQDVVRRRHLLTKGREVVGIEDEVFDLDSLSESDRAALHGDAALLSALNQGRTGRMGDIIATIQAEQDRIIRSELGGVLVVEGGPGTGKTAVALHRAAYLLYTFRGRLAAGGVLVLGPNPGFLRYIERVLPSLGESGVLLAAPGTLFPGVNPKRHDSPEVARVKSDERMVDVIRRAVADRQRVPRDDIKLDFEGFDLVLDRQVCLRARAAGRRARRPHNQARAVVERVLLDGLAAQLRAELARLHGEDPQPAEVEEVSRRLRRSRAFRIAMERIWPELFAEELLNDLFGTPALVRSAAPGLTEEERAALTRPRSPELRAVDWSIEDVPLLDEAAQVLGDPVGRGGKRGRGRARQRAQEVRFAQEVLRSLDLAMPIDPVLLADRFDDDAAAETVADRARRDRTWAFSHVIVDEAQELSPMAWRMVFRRCPSRSMTIVGDLAQTGATWGVSSWAALLDRHAPGRWRAAELSVNYRTPAEIMDVASAVLAVAAPGAVPPRSMREGGVAPWALRTGAGELSSTLAAAVGHELAAIGDGRLGVIAPAAAVGRLAGDLANALPEPAPSGDTPGLRVVADRAAPLDGLVAVLSVADAKGLEFDAVVVVEPGEICSESERGLGDLYVALTRATRRVGVVHTNELPGPLHGLRQIGSVAELDLLTGASR
jgi:DNA helicase IV